MEEEKVRCTKCKEEKPRSEFYVDKLKKNGLRSRCKSCVREVNREIDKKYRESGEKKRKQKERNDKYKKERVEIDGKACKVCGKWKVRTEYRLNNYTKDGLWAFCKTCFNEKYGDKRKAYNHEYSKGYKEKSAEKSLAYYHRNKDECCRKTRERRLKMKIEEPEKYKAMMRENSRRTRSRYPEKVKNFMLEYRKLHEDEIREKRHIHYIKNKGRIDAFIKVWCKNNPSKVREYSNRKRANKHASVGSFTGQEWDELCAKHDYKCLACGEVKPLTADHVIPISLGGGSDIGNMQPLCRSCNSRKSTKTIDYRPKS